MKAFLAKQPPAGSIGELQRQVDRFVAYYNDVRPHQSIGRKTPRTIFQARDKARPSGPKIRVGAGVRVRRDRIDKGGKLTLRHGTRLHHIGVGHVHKGKRVTMLVNGLDVRVISLDGELLRHLQLDPTRDYQPQGS
jgi:Integrase core domain